MIEEILVNESMKSPDIEVEDFSEVDESSVADEDEIIDHEVDIKPDETSINEITEELDHLEGNDLEIIEQVQEEALDENENQEINNEPNVELNGHLDGPSVLEPEPEPVSTDSLAPALIAAEAAEEKPEVISGKSGLVVAPAPRTRNISECTQEMCDWKSSPCPTKVIGL